jgi:hypothetical protein
MVLLCSTARSAHHSPGRLPRLDRGWSSSTIFEVFSNLPDHPPMHVAAKWGSTTEARGRVAVPKREGLGMEEGMSCVAAPR